MRPSLFQTPLDTGATRCDICHWRCELAPGDFGRCNVRRNVDGVVNNLADELVSAATIVPIEDLRMWHFFPDAQTFTAGSFGTPIVTPPYDRYAGLPPEEGRRSISAERIAAVAQQRLCRGILWTYNDPIISFEWMLDGIKLARAGSRFTAVTTSGFWTPETVQAAAPYLDGVRLDLLGFSDRAYQELADIADWDVILTTAERLRASWNIHIEVTLTLRPGVNDDADQITKLATWMRTKLGSLTPLHILVSPGSDASTALPSVEAARAAGLHFVYGPAPFQPTRCPNCTWVVINRSENPTELLGVINDTCESCGTSLGLRYSIFQRQTAYHWAP